MSAFRRFGLAAATAAILVPLTSCDTGEPVRQAAPQPAPPAQTLELTPAADQKDLPVSAEIGITVANASVRSVAMADAKGRLIPGRLRPGGASWVPDRPLDYKGRYSVTVTATDGRRAITKSTSFSTMAEPQRQVG